VRTPVLCVLTIVIHCLELHLLCDYTLQSRDFQSPERQQRQYNDIATQPIHCQDIWAMGRVLQLAYTEGLPESLTKYVDKMMTAVAARRPTPAQYLRCAFLKRPAVQHLTVMESWSVTSLEDKSTFLKTAEVLKSCPREAVQYKLSNLLLRDVEAVVATAATPNGAASATATRTTIAMALPPLLDIAKDLVSDDTVFSNRLQPVLVSLFTMNDRGIRAMLLSKVDRIAPQLDAATVNNKLFDPLCAGFTDAAAQLRELTLKSMVIFTDKLSDRNMNDKLIKQLTRLQSDPEDSIRTNTIIFLGKIADKLKPAVRDKVLLPAFAKGIKDPFPAARLAGLRATTACAAHFVPSEVCYRVLPSVMPCLIDPASKQVRDAAFSCVDSYMTKVSSVTVSKVTA
jgi:SCY1-like protein 1